MEASFLSHATFSTGTRKIEESLLKTLETRLNREINPRKMKDDLEITSMMVPLVTQPREVYIGLFGLFFVPLISRFISILQFRVCYMSYCESQTHWPDKTLVFTWFSCKTLLCKCDFGDHLLPLLGWTKTTNRVSALVAFQQQQQPSHLSQVFGVGYMNQKRITLERTHGSAFSTHSYRAICLH